LRDDALRCLKSQIGEIEIFCDDARLPRHRLPQGGLARSDSFCRQKHASAARARRTRSGPEVSASSSAPRSAWVMAKA
jgi:hypothetical protein